MNSTQKLDDVITILDFGSQYTQIIARKIRECGVRADIYPYNVKEKVVKKIAPKGIILSGSPWSVNQSFSPHPDFDVYGLGVPVLGICYGMQYTALKFGGKVISEHDKREYGRAKLLFEGESPLFAGMQSGNVVWMSHGDSVGTLPTGFKLIAKSENCPVAAIENSEKRIYCVQFHPEVKHTEEGTKLLENFAVNLCGCAKTWTSKRLIEDSIATIRQQVGEEHVICALSGGVDSTVLAVLLHKAIGKQLKCIHIDSGLMRLGESKNIVDMFHQYFDMGIELVNGSEQFLAALHKVKEPEKKRKIIGKQFIKLFELEAEKNHKCRWLAQGTLYPDVIESISVNGPSQTIKSHHNVGGLPKRMKLKIIEPFRNLFKDEVRTIGRELGIPEWFIGRHPFPGPGLGIRILGEITPEKIAILQKADDIFISELHKHGLYDDIWQAFAVLLPVQSVGVMGDERTYEYTCVIRAVDAIDGMTAEWHRLPYEFLDVISSRICNEVKGINRVVYDITSKPPATIEWE